MVASLSDQFVEQTASASRIIFETTARRQIQEGVNEIHTNNEDGFYSTHGVHDVWQHINTQVVLRQPQNMHT